MIECVDLVVSVFYHKLSVFLGSVTNSRISNPALLQYQMIQQR